MNPFFKILESTNDTSDRTAEILEQLQRYGACTLGTGVFYVQDLMMPDGSALFGMGAATRLILPPAQEAGFAVGIGSMCTVQSLGFYGAETDVPAPQALGERHGLVFKGNATLKDWKGQPHNSIVDGCFFSGFSGGGITCIDTGYDIRSALTVSNCHMFHCGAGVNIAHFSEYHRFTNIHSTCNLYGCINNGGNNVFSACLFDANTVGFWIDNSRNQSPNNSHGSVTGCTFNHCGENRGIGILLQGATSGHVFTGCQCFYSEIVVEDSSNIVFSSFNFGANQRITVKGEHKILFADCVFAKAPTVLAENADRLSFVNCFTAEDEPVTV